MYTDNISTFRQIYRLEFRGFAIEFFTVLLLIENLAWLSLGFIFKKLSAHDFLAFRVIWKQAFRLDFSIFQKPCFYGQTSLWRWIFARLWYVFSWFVVLSIYKKLLKVSDHCVEKIQHESTTLPVLLHLDHFNSIQYNFWQYDAEAFALRNES